MSKKRKTRTRGPIPSSGKSLLIPGLGYFRLPDTAGDLEDWRQAWHNALGDSDALAAGDAITDAMRDAITTGHGTVDDADIPGLIIFHRPDGTDTVAHIRDIARDAHSTEAAAWESIDELVSAGVLTPCADEDSDNGCADGGYRMTVPGAEARTAP